MIDLHFADHKNKLQFTCSACVKNPYTAKERRCQEPGFAPVFKKPRRIDDFSDSYLVCPGKATWYAEISELFQHCRLALETGIMPIDDTFQNQPELFVEVFPYFVQRWNERKYQRIWQDVRGFVVPILESIFGGKKGST